MPRSDFQSNYPGKSGWSHGGAGRLEDDLIADPPGFAGVPHPLQSRIKRALDIVGALAILALVSVPYLLVVLVILVTMGRPVHYWQVRLGKDGKAFHFYKFRSMVRNSSAVLQEHLGKNSNARREWNEFQKLKKDPRVTRFGQFIRRFSIDELPQLFNVLKGDMSMVGPRPCMLRQRSLYGRQWRYYCAVRPGITGLWQISGRNRLPYSKRVELDVEYVTNWSLKSDFKVLLGTFKAVLQGEGR